MNKNFWTEDNKIMNYDDLFRIDMHNKLMKMENQIVCGKDIADLCYNYDYLISQKGKAAQFIADYAEHFVRSLDQYKKAVGKPFEAAQDPLKAVNLMALYKGKEIALECETVKSYWDRKMVLNLEMLNNIFQEMEASLSQNRERLAEKVLLTKETLSRTSAQHMCDHLQKMVNENISLAEALRSLDKPILSERTVRSIIKNDYSDVVKTALACNASTNGVKPFVEDVVLAKSKELFEKEFAMANRQVPLSRDLFMVIQNTLLGRIPHEVELKPLTNVRTNQRSDSVKESQRLAREK